MNVDDIDVKKITDIAIEAGELIMEYYLLDEIETTRKSDNSPVTHADIAASDLIIKRLYEINAKIPVISEESSQDENLKILKNYKVFWLIDPIDGTWSFIRKNGVFTVNIALIQEGRAIQGVIYSPLDRVSYYSDFNSNAYKVENNITTAINANDKFESGFDFLVSNPNLNQQTQEFIERYLIKTITPVHSSIKFALIAEGKGDIYPRFKITCIWDTAAGHAILNAAGGEVYDLNGAPLRYNKQLENPSFVAVSSESIKLL